MWRDAGAAERAARRRSASDPRDRDVVRRDRRGGRRRRRRRAVVGRRVAGRPACAVRRRRPRGRLPAAPRARRAGDPRGARRRGRSALDDVAAVGVTQGPGLVGALLVGLSAAKALAWSRGLPLVPVDHLRGHVATLYLEPDPLDPPFTCLLASGGHTLLLAVRDRTGFDVLGSTLDDAAGEAFDKGARLLGLGYPGRRRDRPARAGRRPGGVLLPGRARPRARLLVLGAEDRAPVRGARPLGGRARRAAGRSRRLVPAGDRARARRRGCAPPPQQTGDLRARGRRRRGRQLGAPLDALPDARFAPLRSARTTPR